MRTWLQKVKAKLPPLTKAQGIAVLVTLPVTTIGAIALVFVFKKWNERTSKLVCVGVPEGNEHGDS